MTEENPNAGMSQAEIELNEKLQNDQINNMYDDEDRKKQNDYKAGTKRNPLGTNVLLMLGRLITPQTTGYPQVNLDMSFANLGDFDMIQVRDSSFIINFCRIHGLKKSEYMERGKLATILNSSKSHRAKTMSLFTHTVATQRQEYRDDTDEKTGFMSRLFMKKKTAGARN